MSDAIVKPHPYSVDLAKPVKKTYLDTLLVTQDDKANRFDISLYRDKAPLTMPSGAAVSAYFIRYSDNATIHIDGIASGNVASVTLKDNCYNKAGQFALIIKVLNGGVISTVFYGEGTILASSTDTIVDEENVVPSLEDLLNQIAVMEAATANANTAAEAAGAWANASAVAVTVGENESAAVNVSEDASGNKVLTFSVPQGKKGDPGTAENVSIKSIDGLEEALAAKLDAKASAADSKLLNGKDCVYYLQPVNLLDNSNFAKPINQKGAKTYSGVMYYIDRWYGIPAAQTFSVLNGWVTITAGYSEDSGICQKIANIASYAGKKVTFAVRVNSPSSVSVGFINASGATVHETVSSTTGTRTVLCTYTVPSGATADSFIPRIVLKAAAADDYAMLYWAALYEGEYTAENLPPYVPKPEIVELLTCQQHYLPLNSYVRYPLTRISSGEIDFMIPLPVEMRGVTKAPTIVGTFSLMAGTTVQEGFSCIVAAAGRNTVAVRFSKTSHGLTTASNLCMQVSSGAALDRNLGVTGVTSSGDTEE